MKDYVATEIEEDAMTMVFGGPQKADDSESGKSSKEDKKAKKKAKKEKKKKLKG